MKYNYFIGVLLQVSVLLSFSFSVDFMFHLYTNICNSLLIPLTFSSYLVLPEATLRRTVGTFWDKSAFLLVSERDPASHAW